MYSSKELVDHVDKKINQLISLDDDVGYNNNNIYNI